MNSPSELFDDHHRLQPEDSNRKRQRCVYTSNSHNRQEEEEEEPVRRFPCRARGLSTAHNIGAWIEIPANAPHGLLVYCIHPECKASGRKFKYCEVCSMPVAQRNFSSRHGHGRILDDSSQQQLAKKKARIRYVERTGSLPNTTTTRPAALSIPCSVMSFQEGAVSASFLQQQQQKQSSSTTTPQVVYQLGEEEKKWLSLLWRRPAFEDAPEMSIWLGQVLDQVTPRETSAPDCKYRDDLLKLFVIAPRGSASSSL